MFKDIYKELILPIINLFIEKEKPIDDIFTELLISSIKKLKREGWDCGITSTNDSGLNGSIVIKTVIYAKDLAESSSFYFFNSLSRKIISECDSKKLSKDVKLKIVSKLVRIYVTKRHGNTFYHWFKK